MPYTACHSKLAAKRHSRSSLLFIMATTLFGLSACGGGSGTTPPAPDPAMSSPAPAPTPVPTPAPAPAPPSAAIPAAIAAGTCTTAANGQTALQAAATGLSAGSWCTLGTGGLTWSLINDPQYSGHFLEYASQGVYDPVRKKVRYHGGADPGYSQCLEYDEASNQWSRCPNAHRGYTDHGWDNNAVDPSTGNHYVFESRTPNFRRWNGSAWSSIANDTQCLAPLREPMVGLTWDSDRGGLIQFSDSGVCFWKESTNTWTYLGHAPGVFASYHFIARHHPKAGLVWLQDGNNSSRNHWKLALNGQITKLSAAPLNLGCCGSGGVLSSYDYGSEKMIVADPFGNRWFEYDIVTDTWRPFTNSLPLNNARYDTSNVEGIVVPISTYGVLLYVMARGAGGTPQAYLYKHIR